MEEFFVSSSRCREGFLSEHLDRWMQLPRLRRKRRQKLIRCVSELIGYDGSFAEVRLIGDQFDRLVQSGMTLLDLVDYLRKDFVFVWISEYTFLTNLDKSLLLAIFGRSSLLFSFEHEYNERQPVFVCSLRQDERPTRALRFLVELPSSEVTVIALGNDPRPLPTDVLQALLRRVSYVRLEQIELAVDCLREFASFRGHLSLHWCGIEDGGRHLCTQIEEDHGPTALTLGHQDFDIQSLKVAMTRTTTLAELHLFHSMYLQLGPECLRSNRSLTVLSLSGCTDQEWSSLFESMKNHATLQILTVSDPREDQDGEDSDENRVRRAQAILDMLLVNTILLDIKFYEGDFNQRREDRLRNWLDHDMLEQAIRPRLKLNSLRCQLERIEQESDRFEQKQQIGDMLTTQETHDDLSRLFVLLSEHPGWFF